MLHKVKMRGFHGVEISDSEMKSSQRTSGLLELHISADTMHVRTRDVTYIIIFII